MTGAEIVPIVAEAAIKSLASIITTTVGKAGINLLGETGGALWDGAGNLTQEAWNLFVPISKKYIENYTNRHGILKVLVLEMEMSEPVSLDSVYTAVQLMNPETRQNYESLEALEEAFRQDNNRGFSDKKCQKHSGIGIANEKQYLMVLGGPGMGKSTFLRKVGLEALKGKQGGDYQHTRIPVFLELKNFRSGEINLEEAIAEEFKNCRLPKYAEFTTEFLNQGRLLILFDGLDEVPTEHLNQMVTSISNFVDRYSQNRFIISCRIAARHNFRRFTDVEIAYFDNDQIENFITNWFSSQPEQGQECWQKLNSGDYKAAKELAQTPLLLTLICLLYRKAGQFPTSRATLYEKALRVLLEEWAADQGIRRRQLYQGLDTRRKELMLSQIAYQFFVEDRLFFQTREVAEQIEQLLTEMLPNENSIDGRDVLKAIEVQHGILVARAEGFYSFSHLTIQEFLTAYHIYNDLNKIQDIVTKHLEDRRWREVFLLLSGLSNRADELLLPIEEQIQTYLINPKLQNLLAWVEQVADTSEGDIKPVGKRALALALASTNANANIFIINALISELAKVNVESPSIKLYAEDNLIDYLVKYAQLSKERQIYQGIDLDGLIISLENLKKGTDNHQSQAQEIEKTWLDAFHLSPEMLYLSEEELDALNNYLYANRLMLGCRQEAVLVSPQIRSQIEGRMLLPTGSSDILQII